ncbi:MAG: 3-isopropylmalate dehydratase small subunit [Chloroflexi bacterium]|nr:3-isopropylmalate dehydratase small subunit [Chloroflexota bacterium]
MEPFVNVTGVVLPLERANVDTDQICPAQFLKRIERTGFGQFLFHSWRFLPDGSPNPDFVLNHPVYRQATVLVARRNFGSGSSREHAVWALQDYGIRAVIAPSYAEIFHKNAFENGLCPVLLPEEQVETLLDRAKERPGYQLTVDLEQCLVTDNLGLKLPFVMHTDPETHAFRRHCLLNGLDEIGLTLQQEDKIAAFEQRRAKQGYLLPA